MGPLAHAIIIAIMADLNVLLPFFFISSWFLDLQLFIAKKTFINKLAIDRYIVSL